MSALPTRATRAFAARAAEGEAARSTGWKVKSGAQPTRCAVCASRGERCEDALCGEFTRAREQYVCGAVRGALFMRQGAQAR